MKKTVLFFAFALALFFYLYLPLPCSRAQEFDFAKAYQDYLYTQTIYDQAYSDYNQAKNNYLKNPTLTLKEEARKKTYGLLTARDELFRVYLTTVRMKLREIEIPIPARLDEEIAWYQTHKNTYKFDDPLDILFGKAKETESRFKSHTSPITYESLFDISAGEIENLKKGHEKVYQLLKNSIDLGVTDGVLKLDPFNRWFTDIENVLKELDESQTKARAKIIKITEGSALEPKSAFTSAVSDLSPAITKLTELNNFLTELLNSINTQLNRL